jgi:transcriptional repressor NrdR
MEAMVDQIEDALSQQAGVEIPSSHLGEMLMERLKPLDRVAYVRFASVYRNFQDIDEFQDFVDDLNARQRREAQARDQAELPL